MNRMARIKCPCCGYYTFEDEEHAFFGICKVCFYQNDFVGDPDTMKGANKVTLNEARANYKKYGICEERFIEDKDRLVHEPYDYELPENN